MIAPLRSLLATGCKFGRRIIIGFYFLFGITLLSYAGHSATNTIFDRIIHQPQNTRVDTATKIYKNNFRRVAPAVAMQKLDELGAIALQLDDKPLQCAVLGMRADYYSVNDGFNPQSTAYYQQAIDFAIKNKLQYETGVYLQATGRYYYIFHRYALACQCYLKSKEIFSEVGYDKVPDISNHLSNIADLYYALADYDNAKANLELALKYAPPGTRAQINIVNTIGLIYRNYRQFPQALNYFDKAFKFAVNERDTVWMGILKGNIGSVYFLQNQYEKALPYIETDYKVSITNKQDLNGLISLLRLIKINIDLKRYPVAGEQLNIAEKMLNNGKEDMLGQAAIYDDLRSQLDEALGKTADAIAYRKKFEIARDSLAKRDNIATIQRVQLRYEIDKRTEQLNQLKDDEKIQEIETDATVAVLVLLTVISVLVYKRQKLKNYKDKELFLAEKRALDEELKNAAISLNLFTENLRQKNMLIEDFKQEIEKLNLQSAGKANAENLENLLQAHIMTDENWNDFKVLFTKVYPGFFIGLSKNQAQFSPSEIRILSLIKLGLTNTEMANMLGITVEGIKKAKQRLRKKIDFVTIHDMENAFE